METGPALFDTAFWISTGIILFLLVLSGFFSGSETALTAASRGKLRAQADKGVLIGVHQPSLLAFIRVRHQPLERLGQ